MTDELFEERLRRDLRRLTSRMDLPTAATSGLRRGAILGCCVPRRRWQRALRRGLTAAIPAAVVVFVLLGPGHLAGSAGPSAPPHLDPTAVAAPRFPGALAYLSGGSIFTAEPGSGPTAVGSVPSPGSVPQWSADGAWVAELDGAGQLRIERASGRLVDLPAVVAAETIAAFEWSSSAPLLALVPSGGPDAGELVVVDPATPGAAPDIVASSVTSFLWSHDGHRLAYSIADGSRPERIATVDLVTGARTTLPFTPPADTSVLLGSWWPDGDGLVLWLDPGGSAAAEATGLPLVSLALDASDARPLGRTFVYLPWLAWSPDGRELVIVDMHGAFPWDGSHLAVCRPGPTPPPCQALSQPADTVSIDPAWAPDGQLLAFVRAMRAPGLTPGPGITQWYGSRRLWTALPDGAEAHEIAAAGAGVADPVFGPSGRTLTYAGSSDIATIGLAGGKPTIIAAGLSGALGTAGPDGFGKLPWGGIPAWGPPA